MNSKTKRLADCQRIIGYYFASADLLATALTHSSLRAPDRDCNERLEFLGDSVLGLVITEELYHRLPDSAEGEMTRIKSAVVSRAALHSSSLRLGLPAFAEFARGVGRRDELPTSVIANLVEAVIGAIYLDAGYYPAREFVLRHMRSEIEEVCHQGGGLNYKSQLQHEVQQAIGVTPHYRTVEEDGPDHEKRFVVAAVIQGKEYGRAEGANKKEAEQEAARETLEAWSKRRPGRRRRTAPTPEAAEAGMLDEPVTAPSAETDAPAGEAPAREAPARKARPSRRRTAKPKAEAAPRTADEEQVAERPRRRRRSRTAEPAAPEADVPAAAAPVADKQPAPARQEEVVEAAEKPRARRRRSRNAEPAAPEADVPAAAAPVADKQPAPARQEEVVEAAEKPRARRRRSRNAEPAAPEADVPAAAAPVADKQPAPARQEEVVEAAAPPRPRRRRRAREAEAQESVGGSPSDAPATPEEPATPSRPAPEKKAPARKPAKPAAKKNVGFAAGIFDGEAKAAEPKPERKSPAKRGAAEPKPERKASAKPKAPARKPAGRAPKTTAGFAAGILDGETKAAEPKQERTSPAEPGAAEPKPERKAPAKPKAPARKPAQRASKSTKGFAAGILEGDAKAAEPKPRRKRAEKPAVVKAPARAPAPKPKKKRSSGGFSDGL